MAVLGFIGALIAVVLGLLWRVNSAATAVRGLTEAAEDAHGFWRRMLWRRRLANDPLELVKDPREAAAAMMFAVAEADGALTAAEQAAILAEMRGKLQTTEAHVQELAARGRWVVRDVRDLDRCLTKLDRVLEADHRADVVGMLERVAAADGVAPPAVRATLERYRRGVAASMAAARTGG